MCNDFKFYKGEKRALTGTVTPENRCEKAIIVSAYFELIKKSDKKIVQSGDCEVAGDTAKMLIDFGDVTEGSYELRLQADVGTERIIKTQDIEVLK